MSTNCLVTTLKGKVNNPNLPFFGFDSTLQFYNNSSLFYFSSNTTRSKMMKVLSGTVYADVEHTIPITDVACTAWEVTTICFITSEASNTKIALNTMYIGCLGNIQRLYDTTDVPPFKIDPKEFFGAKILYYNLKSCKILGDDKSIEPFFIDIYRYLLSANDTRFERSNINTPKLWPTVSNNVNTSWALKTFNGQSFNNGYLCMATDFANNTFYLYDKVTLNNSDTEGTLNDDDIVASYNYTTGEWTYYE